MSSKNIDFFSYGNTIDGTTYCSGVETLAENVIEDNEQDSVLIYPSANGWARVRSESYRMTTDNAEAVLPLPIYKINKVLLKPVVDFVTVKLWQNVGGYETEKEINININDFSNNKGEYISLDITNLVLSEEEWKTLPIAKSTNAYKEGIYKDNTFYWSKGSNIIPFLGTVYKKIGLTNTGFSDSSPTYTRLLAYLGNKIEKQNFTYTYTDAQSNMGFDQVVSLNDIGISKILPWGNVDVRDWQYRIEYVPITSAFKMKARKSAETTVDYLQPFNQRAEINSASAFGKNMYLTAQKTGVRELTVVKNYARLADIPPLGALVKHNGKRYRLIANTYKQTNTIYVQVTHTLSENWTSKSKHVAVDQKYRNWNIPQDMLWRNLYWEDFLCITKTPIEISKDESAGISLDNIMQVLKTARTNDKTIDTLGWIFQGNTVESENLGVVLPCSTFGIGNSLVFSATMKDQLSAGLREVEKNLCEEALYCNADGTLDTIRIILSEGYSNGGFDLGNFQEIVNNDLVEKAKQYLPTIYYDKNTMYAYNYPNGNLFDKVFYIDKDPAEAIKFTYQVHLTPYGSEIVVGNAFAEYNPLVKKWASNRTFKLHLLKEYLRDGVDNVVNSENVFTQTVDNAYFKLEKQSGEIYHLSLTNTIIDDLLSDSNNYVAWAITDENNKLYVGMNSRLNFDLYFQIQHKRR